MEPHFIVQASGAMFDTIEPEGWTYVFGIFVTDQSPILAKHIRQIPIGSAYEKKNLR